MSKRNPERPESPGLRPRRGCELSLSGPSLVGLTRAVLDKGRSFRFCARGWSMSPFIRDGDVITVAPPPPGREPGAKACGIGRVVAFVNPDSRRLVVHRIVGRHEFRFLVLGDNARGMAGDLVNPDDVLGRVVRIERGRKRVWLGLGPERYAVALLSRAGVLLPVLSRAGTLTRFLRRRHHESN